MTKTIEKLNCINRIGTLQCEEAPQGWASVRLRPNQTIMQELHHLESKFVDLQVCIVDVGAVIGRLGEMCCVKGLNLGDRQI